MIRILSEGFRRSKHNKNISGSMIRIQSQDFGGNKYSKNVSDNTIRIKSQDFGGVRAAILSELTCFFIYTNENKRKHNPNCPYIPDHPYRILIIRGSGSGKTNALLNLIDNQSDADKIYLYAKDPYEDNYQFLINKRESIGLKYFIVPKAFIEYSNDIHDVYKNIDHYNPDK